MNKNRVKKIMLLSLLLCGILSAGICFQVVVEGINWIERKSEARQEKGESYYSDGLQENKKLSNQKLQEREGLLMYEDHILNLTQIKEENAENLIWLADRLIETYPQLKNVCIMPIPERYMLEKGFENKKKEYEVFIKKLQEKEGKSIIVINSLPELEKHMEEFIFFRTESSWTMRGAFYGMQEYRKKLEYKADDLNRYREYMFSVFTGDLKAKAVLLWENSSYEDVVRNIPNDPYYIYMGEDNPNRQKLTVDKGEKSKACNTLQMSSAGTSGIIGHSYIHSIVKGSGTGKIILLTDSRGKYLISFLSELYEEIYVVNIREDKQFLADLNELTENEGFDQILWAQNASEIGDKSYMSAISPLLDGRKRGES